MDAATRERLREEVSVVQRLRLAVDELAERVDLVERRIEPWRFSMAAVTEHRRHAVKEMREHGFSLATIASALGVALATVQRDLGVTEHATPPRVLGLDQKTYPARKGGRVEA